jgi:hypothetical protein
VGQSSHSIEPKALDICPREHTVHSVGHGGNVTFKYRPTGHFSHKDEEVKYSPALHCTVGSDVGKGVGAGVGKEVGVEVGGSDGAAVGEGIGREVGKRVGNSDGR